ncbi:hypothetical protein ACFE04_003120 [Oxalis oulophora]
MYREGNQVYQMANINQKRESATFWGWSAAADGLLPRLLELVVAADRRTAIASRGKVVAAGQQNVADRGITSGCGGSETGQKNGVVGLVIVVGLVVAGSGVMSGWLRVE